MVDIKLETAFSEVVRNNLAQVSYDEKTGYLKLVNEMLLWAGIVEGVFDQRYALVALSMMVCNLALTHHVLRNKHELEMKLLMIEEEAIDEFWSITKPLTLSLDSRVEYDLKDFWEEYNNTNYERS